MANTNADLMMATLTDIVQYANSTGSVNLYMAHGGTNFGYWAGLPPDLYLNRLCYEFGVHKAAGCYFLGFPFQNNSSTLDLPYPSRDISFGSRFPF